MQKLRSISCLAAMAFAVAGASPAMAEWAPKWLHCDGQSVTTGTVDGKPVNETKPAADIYAFDDASKNFYKYSETRKSTDPEPVTLYSDNRIEWAALRGMGHSSGPEWKGVLDRKTLSLTLNYDEGGTKMSWSQTCKPTDPPAGSSVAQNKGLSNG